MNQFSSFRLTQKDGYESEVFVWGAEQSPRGVIQLAHGMGEYATRYNKVCGELVEAGFAVYANDHRGHGNSAMTAGSLGDFGSAGFPALASDMASLSEHIQNKHPDLPLFLLGHSMGSFASQLYVLEHGDKLKGMILSGSSALDIMAAQFAQVELVDGEFPNVLNAPFEPSRTEFDWLSRDEAQVDAYIASPLCGFATAPDSFASLLAAGEKTADAAAISNIDKNLPIYIFSGDKDPVGGNTELLDVLAKRYRDAGIKDVSTRYYPEGRHEMFNEINRTEVIAELIVWLEKHLDG